MENNINIYTVTQLNNHSKNLIETSFTNIWVKGEVTSIFNYKSGNVYFSLKDESSEIPCVIFNVSLIRTQKSKL